MRLVASVEDIELISQHRILSKLLAQQDSETNCLLFKPGMEYSYSHITILHRSTASHNVEVSFDLDALVRRVDREAFSGTSGHLRGFLDERVGWRGATTNPRCLLLGEGSSHARECRNGGGGE